MSTHPYDAILIVSFGGPEAPEEVVPFLENVTRGRGIPKERLEQVGEHYFLFGGKSPINDHCRALIAALEPALHDAGIDLPIYWGNRNWNPMLTDTVQQMADDGVTRAIAFVTSATSSYSGCRQYREDIERAREAVGDAAPEIHKIRQYYDHPGFIEPMVDHVTSALDSLGESAVGARLVFTAHSIPTSMSDTSDYEAQLTEAARLVAEGAARTDAQRNDFDLVWQSRSGPPQVPWLEPDINDHLEALHREGVDAVVVIPIGFISDHMEVMFDLDTEAKDLCDELGINMVRSLAVGIHPKFVSMIRELVQERIADAEKRAIGSMPPNWDVCPQDCCLYKPQRPSRPRESSQ